MQLRAATAGSAAGGWPGKFTRMALPQCTVREAQGVQECGLVQLLPPFHVARGSRLGRSHASAMPNPRPPPLPLAIIINAFL